MRELVSLEEQIKDSDDPKLWDNSKTGGWGGWWRGNRGQQGLRSFPAEKKVWVGGLPEEGVTFRELQAHFPGAKFATVKKGKGGLTGGLAYATAEEATAAVKTLNGSLLGGKAIEVDVWTKWNEGGTEGKAAEGEDGKPLAKPTESLKNFSSDKKVWVGGLPEDVTSVALQDHFTGSKFAVVTKGKSGRTGGVAYATAEEATAAIQDLNGSSLGGKTIEVDKWTEWNAAAPSEVKATEALLAEVALEFKVLISKAGADLKAATEFDLEAHKKQCLEAAARALNVRKKEFELEAAAKALAQLKQTADSETKVEENAEGKSGYNKPWAWKNWGYPSVPRKKKRQRTDQDAGSTAAKEGTAQEGTDKNQPTEGEKKRRRTERFGQAAPAVPAKEGASSAPLASPPGLEGPKSASSAEVRSIVGQILKT